MRGAADEACSLGPIATVRSANFWLATRLKRAAFSQTAASSLACQRVRLIALPDCLSLRLFTRRTDAIRAGTPTAGKQLLEEKEAAK